MKTSCLALALSVGWLAAAIADEPTELSQRLAVFQPLIGKTMRGEFAESTPEKPMIDVSRWERAMNGNAVRILHSVNDGIYGGETLLMWDAQQKKIACWYFTTAGFYTEGTMDVDGPKWSSFEKVSGNDSGITEVKATSEIAADGSLIVKSEYLRDGKWSPGHEIRYTEAPGASVVFQ